ncbi:MAG: ankyrin repeat domain-containing protein [Alphaproteobacteria bacterium]|nr:ankyrin repeat domain-containing protein [Alphaproteobacteria bacterium]
MTRRSWLLLLAGLGAPAAATPARAQYAVDQAVRAPFALANASRDGNYWFVRNSLIAGVSPNARDAEQRPALLLAAMNGHGAVVEILLQYHAQVNLTDAQRNTALTMAAGRGFVEIVEALIRGRANVNAANGVGETPLFIAARNGHTRVVETLLRGGADVNQADFTGRTPLAAAERSNSPNKRSVIEVLRRGGARG